MGILETGFESRSKILYFLKLRYMEFSSFQIRIRIQIDDHFFKFLIEKKVKLSIFPHFRPIYFIDSEFFFNFRYYFWFWRRCSLLIALLVKETILFIFSSQTRTVVRECCKDDDESLWKSLKFDLSPRKNGLTDRPRNLHRWLRPGYQKCKILCRSDHVFFLPIWVKCNS